MVRNLEKINSFYINKLNPLTTNTELQTIFFCYTITLINYQQQLLPITLSNVYYHHVHLDCGGV